MGYATWGTTMQAIVLPFHLWMARGTAMSDVVHNLDRYMADLRQILAQGRKRVGLLLGAGVPLALTVDEHGHIDRSGTPLIPAVTGLTQEVLLGLSADDRAVIDNACARFTSPPNIESILSQIRLLAKAIGSATVHSLNADQYNDLAQRICNAIGKIVNKPLPMEPNSFTALIGWVGGIPREHAVEIFTPNYDLLLEEAFERALVPYFDGFCGASLPFFDASTIANDDLPSRWARIWKLHGSLGWKASGDRIVRTGEREATQLIYPDHLKYDQTKKLPYAALFDRMRTFLSSPDTLLITCGFSYSDAHICAVLEEALSSAPGAAIFACQYNAIDAEPAAVEIALRQPNFSLYARDKAVAKCTIGRWHLGEPPNDEWRLIRRSYWLETGSTDQGFALGDFVHFARFLAQSQAQIADRTDEARAGIQ